jgi:sugar transferase (PEP-CTERM/EpsH1 system associated)
VRILFLSQRLPYAPNRGDRVRAYHILRHLRQYADVDVLSFVHDNEEASHVTEAASLASTVEIVRVPRMRNLVRSLVSLLGDRPTTHTMLDAPGLSGTITRIVSKHSPSVVLAYCSGVAPLALVAPLAGVPLVLDMVDVDSAKWAALAAVTPPPRGWVYAREARVLARFERDIARRAFTTLVTTDKERDTLRAIAPDARIEVMQNGVDVTSLRPPDDPAGTPTVVFCGVMNYAPNEEGARWLAREVWRLVRRRRPDAHLQLVGSSPTRAVRRLASTASGIEVTGHVTDVRPYLWNAAIAVAPLLTARGIQNKVLEAVAAGLPNVVTPVVMAGLPGEVRASCIVAASATAFADAIVALLNQSPGERRECARRTDFTALSWDRTLEPLTQMLIEAAGSSAPGLPRGVA